MSRIMNEDLKQSVSEKPEDSWRLGDALLALGAFLMIVALAAGAYVYFQTTKPPVVVEGSQAPDFSFPLLGGGEARLSDYRGKVVLVNIWNTTCLECKKEMPLMQAKYQAVFKGKPFEILAVSTDQKGAEEVQPFVDNLFYDDMSKVRLTFPILLDTKNEVGSIYQTVKYPESFIVDREGNVSKIIIGRLTETDFQLISHLVELNSSSTTSKTGTG
ncbi:MAG: TlpA disulfide reductase family protein [Thermoleophilia bacterium]